MPACRPPPSPAVVVVGEDASMRIQIYGAAKLITGQVWFGLSLSTVTKSHVGYAHGRLSYLRGISVRKDI